METSGKGANRQKHLPAARSQLFRAKIAAKTSADPTQN